MLRLNNIKKDYFIEGHKIEVLKGINLEISEGDMISLVGKSGAGKSTLLNIIATLEKPDSGEISINGENPSLLKDKKLSKFRNREVGIVFQFHYLLQEFTALENVAMANMIGGNGNSYKKAEEMLIKVGLQERLHHKPAELSGGEQQRVAIARALVTEPNILLLDEPTGNLDDETGSMVWDLIMKLVKEHKTTTIFVTHNRRFAELTGCTYHLEQGVLCRI